MGKTPAASARRDAAPNAERDLETLLTMFRQATTAASVDELMRLWGRKPRKPSP